MFEILLNMEKPSKPPPKKKKKKIKTATISSPPTEDKSDTNNDPNQILPNIDFMDFVPTENNSDDFDLTQIIDNINKENQTDEQLAIAPVSTTVQKQNINLQAAIPNPNQANPPNVSNLNNITTMQNYPFLPKMIFPNSNVTINYNFGK